MGDQGPQPLGLEFEQPVARPPVPGDLLAGQGPQPVRLGRGAGGVGVGADGVEGEGFGVEVVEVDLAEVIGASPLRRPACPGAP
jgi:hypothetical protein